MKQQHQIIEEGAGTETLKNLLQTVIKKINKLSTKVEKRKSSTNKEKKNEDKSKTTLPKIRTKNAGRGRRETYDYAEYEQNHREVDASLAQTIINRINTELLNVAAVARLVFPDHTDEGAQSHLRKILKGEKKMTQDVADTLLHLIDTGMIPTT